jgi:GAF domain-containing protein/anti-sigma regulatory factor (Ser/Thr protein kinase)
MTDQPLASPFDLDNLFSQILGQAIDLLPIDSGGITLYDSESNTLFVHTYHNMPSGLENREIRLGEGLIGQVAQSRTAQIIDYLTDELRHSGSAWSALAVPILREDRLLGVFLAEAGAPNTYTPQHLKILTALANQAAMAHGLLSQYDQLARRYERLSSSNETLYVRNEISHLSVSDEPLETLLPQMLAYVTALIRADACAITLWDAKEERTIRLTAYGLDLGDYLSARRRPEGASSLTAQIVKTGELKIFNDAQSITPSPTPLISEYEAHAVMASPLIARGTAIGAAFLINLRQGAPFTHDHADLIDPLLDQIALIIDNRLLVQNMQDRLAQANALQETAAVASNSMSVDQLLGRSLAVCRKALNVGIGSILLYQRSEGVLELHLGGAFGLPSDMPNVRFPVNDPHNVAAIAFNSGSPYINNDMRRRPPGDIQIPLEYADLVKLLNLRNLMLIPLRVQDEPMGIIWVGNKEGNFSRADAQLLVAMGSHIAAALRSNELIGDTRERLSEMESLQQIAEITSSTLDIDDMLERALYETSELVEADGLLIGLLDLGSNTLRPHAYSRFGAARDLPYAAIPLDSAEPMARAFNSGQAIPHLEYALHNEAYELSVFPLNTRNRTLGALGVLYKHPRTLSDLDFDMLRAVASQITTSIENAQLFGIERKRADLAALVSQISQELTGSLNLADLTKKVVDAVHQRFGYNTVNLFLLEDSREYLAVQASISANTAHILPTERKVLASQGLLGRALGSRETQVVNDISNQQAQIAVEGIAQPEQGSLVVVPLRSGKRLLGAIEVLAAQPNAFDRTDCLALETLAAQVSVAIENARLWDQARRRLLEQGIVHQIGQDLTSILDYPDLINAVVKRTTQALDVAYGLLVIHDADLGRLTVEAEYRLADTATMPSQVGQPLHAMQQNLLASAVQARRQLILSRENAGEASAYFDAANIEAELIIPMIANDQVIGCMLWIETRIRREFSGEDVRLAQTLTAQASIAIENARLFRRAQRQAREQALLWRFAVGLSIWSDVGSMLDHFAQELAKVFSGVDNVVIATRNPTKHLQIDALYLTSGSVEQTLIYYLQRNPVAQNQINAYFTNETALQMNAELPTKLTGLLAYQSHRAVSALLVPIMWRREMIGLIEVASQNPHRVFDLGEMQLLEALANQGAIAFDNVSYHEREQRRLRQMERLQISSRIIVGQLRTDVLLETIVKEASRIFDAPAVSLLTRDEERQQYVMRAAVGLSETYRQNRAIPLRDTQEIYVVTLEQALNDEAFSNEQKGLIKAEGLVNAIAIPLVKAGQQLGLINLYSKAALRTLNDEERELAQLFAAQVAVALDNAVLVETLEERARDLIKANKLKSQFLASISHELRTPMNSINGYSEMLLRELYGPLNQKQVDRIERILRNGRNLLALIDDLLDISKIDAGRMELKLEAVNIHNEITATAYNLESQASTKGLYLKVDAPDALPAVRADSVRLRQVITNLLSNALKFTKQGGVTVRIALNEMDGMTQVWTTVSDTGIGIRREDQAIIFDEFRQADGSTTREFGGTGLGLAITKRLVELMGGRIWVESEIGFGSAFTFTIPVDTRA